MKSLIALYTTFTGLSPMSIQPITGSGSNRQYVRLTDSDGHSIIGVIGTSQEENHAFITLSHHFCAQGLSVPRVLAVTSDERRYLQEDLGSRSLFDALRPAREAGGVYGPEERELLRRTITQLPRLQVLGAQGLDFSVCYPQPSMDETNVMFDLNYFKYCFLKATPVDFHELRLEADFRALAHDLLGQSASSSSSLPPAFPTFLYRDFQARNVMLDAHDQPHFIDFQGGRRGPVFYDLASFLWQASARYPSDLREELITVYLTSLRAVLAEQGLPATALTEETTFRQQLRRFVMFRLLQVLGAYGFRGYFERKQHFLDSIPPALDNLRQLLANPGSCPYPELRQTLEQLVSSPSTITPSASITPSAALPSSAAVPEASPSGSSPFTSLSRLRVRVFSFSFKRGIPEDTSGNGGGYVFDCRSTHNPGRYAPYKQLTGLDEPVIRFLEDDGEILTFLQSVYRLADAHVERYLQRGFTDLMFSFGCTGGQHRSVYCAQHLAERLNKKYGIAVELTHREQGVHTLLPAMQK